MLTTKVRLHAGVTVELVLPVWTPPAQHNALSAKVAERFLNARAWKHRARSFCHLNLLFPRGPCIIRAQLRTELSRKVPYREYVNWTHNPAAPSTSG